MGKDIKRGKYGSIMSESPEFAKYLVNQTDASYQIGSAIKVDWVCPSCGNIVRNKSINKVIGRRRIPCPLCADSSSMPERIVASILNQVGVSYISQKTFKWSGRKRYDFYLPDYDAIVEVNGSQHYGFGFEDLSGFTHNEQIQRDKYKEDIAKQNGIRNYFVVDASTVLVDYILPQMTDILKTLGITQCVDKSTCEAQIATRMTTQAARMWNDGKWAGEIGESMGLSRGAVIRLLKKAAHAGLCDYDPKVAQKLSQKKVVARLTRRVRCVTTGEEFNSLADACRHYNISSASNIERACNHNGRHAGVANGEPLSWQYIS